MGESNARVKVVFLGSKLVGFECFSFLIANRTKLNLEIVGALTNNNNVFGNFDVKALAEENNIPVFDNLEALPEVDYLISVQYHEILKRNHIAKAKKLAINLHMAPLPEYRGCNQFSYAIINGDAEFGTTLHRLEEGIDSGAIIAERRFEIPKDCMVNELYNLTVQKSCVLFVEEIENIVHGNYTLTPQEDLFDQRKHSLHYRKEINDLKRIDLDWPAEKIKRHIRATYMPGFEPPYAIVNGGRINFEIKRGQEK